MNKSEHINNLLYADKIDCDRNIRSIAESNLSETAKNIISGFFRDRKELNVQILTENGFYDEQNINSPKSEEKC